MSQDTTPSQLVVEDLLDIEAAAILVKLKPSTIYTLTSRRQIPHIKKGNRLYFLRSELIAWLLQGRRDVITSAAAESHLLKLRKGGV